MSRKGESIYKRKDGRWEGRYIKDRTVQGKAIYGYVYAKTYQEVKLKVCTAITSVKKSENQHVCSELTEATFEEIADKWLKSIHPQIKSSTYIRYRNLLNTYILPKFGKKHIVHISSDEINEYCNALLTIGGACKQGLAAKTVADILSVIRRILKYASSRNLSLLCTGKEVTIKQIGNEMNILSPSAQENLCKYLLQDLSPRNFGILLCLYTGLRIGELCALRWEDISCEEKTIYVHQTMQRLQLENPTDKKTAVTITTPKSPSSIRTIPIPNDLACIMDEYLPSTQGYVLTGNETYIEPRTMQNYFKRVLKEIGITPVNFHSLRHPYVKPKTKKFITFFEVFGQLHSCP